MAGRLNLEYRDYVLWRGQDTSRLTLDRLAARESEPKLLHWAGYKPDSIEQMERADILAFYSRYERSRIGLRSRLTYWYRDQSMAKVGTDLRRVVWSTRQWLAGAPYVAGGSIGVFNPDDLRNFYDVEKNGAIRWRWSQPEASVKLALSPERYRVRIETASPGPMTALKDANPRFFINGTSIPDDCVTISGGTVEIDLRASMLAHSPSQVMGWTIDRMPVGPQEERMLGMPIAALWVFRRTRA